MTEERVGELHEDTEAELKIDQSKLLTLKNRKMKDGKNES